jgi:S1-C subfamily serine protease
MTSHPTVSRLRSRKFVALLIATLALFLPVATPAAHAQTRAKKAESTANAAAGVDPEKLFAAIVKVSVQAVPEARSAATLGREREGSGVVIGDRGLILTIGYLIVEADDVSVTDSRGRTFAARVVAYDHVTGLGLVRTIAPMDAKPVPFGDSGKIANR